MKNFIPILTWLPHYKKEWIGADLSAGITVGVMLIPQGMAYAMLAGLPPIYGLYAAIIPLLVYAIFGTSRQLSVGPVAMDSIIVMTGVAVFAQAGTANFISIAIFLAFLEGLILLFLGLTRMGFLMNFLSQPVISGFTSAAALIIAFSQLKYLLGLPIPNSKYIHEIMLTAFAEIHNWSLTTIVVGAVSIVIIKAAKKFTPKVPATILVVGLGISIEMIFQLSDNGLDILREVPRGLPTFGMPQFHWDLFYDLFPLALTLALVAFLEAASIAKAMQAKHNDYEVKPNQELIALGLSNIVGSFFQSFSVSGGFSRSAVNDQAGAKSGLASIFSAVLVGITLVFLTPLFYHLPKAVLAAIILLAVFGLIDTKLPMRLWKTERLEFVMLLATFLATLIFGIASGIGIGIVISLIILVLKSTYPHMVQLGRIKGRAYYRNLDRFEDAEPIAGMLIVRCDAQLFFANASFFRDNIFLWLKEREKIRSLLIDAQPMNNVDSSALQMLFELVKALSEQGITLQMAGVKGPVRDKFQSNKFDVKMGKENFFMNVHEAVLAHEKIQITSPKNLVLQSNQKQ